MGKQTNISGSQFGGEWTLQKLHIIDEYLKSYSRVLKYQNVKKIYIDGFAGSGKTELKDGKTIDLPLLGVHEEQTSTIVDGSALLSLKYDFDEYYFLELDKNRIEELKANISLSYPQKLQKVHFVNGDSNQTLLDVVNKITVRDRCLMFLDPYALELNWITLETISKCGVIDLWYLFPLSLIRLINKDGNINDGNKEKITKILGTDDWVKQLFVYSPQISIFDKPTKQRISYKAVIDYILSRFKTIFPYVSPKSKMLINVQKNAPMFLLCFMMTNTSIKAVSAADRIVKSVVESTEKL